MPVNDLLPSTEPSKVDCSSQTIDITDDSDVLDVLATDTARRVICTLEESSGTASDIANTLDMSLQSVCYHLDRLQHAELVEVVGTRYSSKGKEMNVYAIVTNPVIVRLGEAKHTSTTNGERRSDHQHLS